MTPSIEGYPDRSNENRLSEFHDSFMIFKENRLWWSRLPVFELRSQAALALVRFPTVPAHGAYSRAGGAGRRRCQKLTCRWRPRRVQYCGCFIPAISAVAGLPHAGGAGGIRYPRSAAAVVHHGIETIALLLEARHQRSLERAAARQLDAHRIDETPVDQNFIMDVGAGRHAGRSDETDHLALPHPLARLHALGIGRHVPVGGLVAVVVFQADVLAVTAFPADLFDDAVAGGENRRAVGRGPVDTGMHLVVAGEEHVKGIAGLYLALEVDVVGVDADHVLDDAWRHLVAQRGLVNALIEPHAGAVVIVVIAVVGGFGDGVHALHVDGDVFAEIGQRGDRFDGGIVGDDHPVGLQSLTRARGSRRHQDA